MTTTHDRNDEIRARGASAVREETLVETFARVSRTFSVPLGPDTVSAYVSVAPYAGLNHETHYVNRGQR